ncbi:hypothetical protein DICSQDRAFT_157406 [Dichomitus squalens LYAD-421 SS1]|uniref:Uncharacterized protein n=1 Tax=Dichomitus squalens (strain LYAD-421) TaxID=732165 RepID=R7SMM2_DICSQ|nr:uncharacterized protein DICSQDRAFT_157406 [Dichomitus squalens LYAD-421 SS1]EJF57381.1 hypothetical protein DICSQDRAFT_157406 [Dichomitus squalens LYAD-421 SS1]
MIGEVHASRNSTGLAGFWLTSLSPCSLTDFCFTLVAQKQPKLKSGVPPHLLLPLSCPPSSSRPLTSWSTNSLNLPSLLPQFSSAALARADEDAEELSPFSPAYKYNGGKMQVPSGTLSHVSYVKVYVTCRLRRICSSEGGPQQRLPWEFQSHAADNA